MVDWANKVLFVLEFKRPSGQRGDSRERRESRALGQDDIKRLDSALEKVARDAHGDGASDVGIPS